MKRWSLKVKVGAYAALLTMLSLGVTAAVILPWTYLQMRERVDISLRENAEELLRDLRNFRGAPVNPRRPFGRNVVPVALRERFLVVLGPEGQVLYRSPNLGRSEMEVGDRALRTMELEGEACRVGAFEDEPYRVLVGTSLQDLEASQRELRLGFLAALPVVGLLAFVGGVWLGRRAVAPVSALTAAAQRISAEHPEERLPLPEANDEIARLTEVVNESFDRMQGSYDAARRFSADASHQLKTPLAVLRGGLEELRRSESLKGTEKEEVEVLMQQTRRLNGLINDLLLLAQVDAGRLRLDVDEIDIGPVLAGALDDLSVLAEGRGQEVEAEVPDELRVCGERSRVALVLQNLIENAAKYTPVGGRIRVAVECGELVRIRVGNSGPGIPEEERESIFERFRRGSQVGERVQGQGLGLNIARELARALGGDLRLVPTRDDWTEFEFTLVAASGRGTMQGGQS